jgi:Ankyrin repeats (3 copies)
LTVSEFFNAIVLLPASESAFKLRYMIKPHIDAVPAALSSCGGFLEIQVAQLVIVDPDWNAFQVQSIHHSVAAFLATPKAAPFQAVQDMCHLLITEACIQYLRIVLICESEPSERLPTLPVNNWVKHHYANFAKHLDNRPLLVYIWSELYTPEPHERDRLKHLSHTAYYAPRHEPIRSSTCRLVNAANLDISAHTGKAIWKRWTGTMESQNETVLPRGCLESVHLESFLQQLFIVAIRHNCIGTISRAENILLAGLEAVVKFDRYAILEYIGHFQQHATADNSTTVQRTFQHAVLVACQVGNHATLSWLLDRGALWQADSKKLEEAMHFAVHAGHISILKLLLQYGISPDCIDENRQTTLSTAAQNGHTEVIQVLLDSGANPNQRDDLFRTPLDYAADHGHKLCKY